MAEGMMRGEEGIERGTGVMMGGGTGTTGDIDIFLLNNLLRC